ncbi:proto-oncogene Mas-like [Eublepharis macularius]|uniref:Proto-oncogene Mas-like n=1 Tax=Eublepharis macularius TaxID=481883 RepID=A0AA97JRL0_EUBMA|nr:proto-oncogene Mas-like [Eublepharis macularius]
MYVTSQLLLTAISIDRCVSILFPIWYRCHRTTHWSTMVCALIWALTCLPTATPFCCLCAFLNSCVNPMIYYMVGRKKGAQRRENLKVILQRAFKEEKEYREEKGTTAQTAIPSE